VVNAAASNQTVDLFVNGQRVGTQSFAFGTGSTACFDVPAGTRTVEFRAAGSTTALARITPDPVFAAGTSNTVVLAGSGTGIRAFTFPDAFTATAGQAGVRVINASPTLGTSDVFVTEPGVTVSGSPTFEDVAFGTATAFENIDAGEVRVRFTDPGTTVVALDANGTPAFNIPANQVRTFVVADVAGGGMPTSEDNVILLQACS
jgi:hypothetical protein